MKKKESVEDIKIKSKRIKEEEILAFIGEYESDDRKSVQLILERLENRWNKYQKELFRLEQLKEKEREYHKEYRWICGMDEAGRGPLAGPVVAGAVILPEEYSLLKLNDSKKLTPDEREFLYEEIRKQAVAVGVGVVGPKKIDEINILQATYLAMEYAVKDLDQVPDLLLNDAVVVPNIPIYQVGIVKGDATCACIAAASIIAKVTRDHLMEDYDERYPEYGFKKHKGYGTKEHYEAIKKAGPCEIHRMTFLKPKDLPE